MDCLFSMALLRNFLSPRWLIHFHKLKLYMKIQKTLLNKNTMIVLINSKYSRFDPDELIHYVTCRVLISLVWVIVLVIAWVITHRFD